MAKQAAAAIAAFKGPEYAKGESGVRTQHSAGPGFPKPDLIMGDFNGPRGSVSQRLIVGDMAEAYDQAGAGYAASWPGRGHHAPFPVFHLDHLFLAPYLRATRYDLVKPVYGYHWPQVADVAVARRP
jgi:endonuclease/exonuclease/phosphatase (EEP) superfamily protein YafD